MTKRDAPEPETTEKHSRGDRSRRKGGGFGLLVGCEAGASLVPLGAGCSFVLGRDRSCDVVVNDASISRRHARLIVDDTITLEDLGSTNGSTVQGRRLGKGEHAQVAIGSVIELGSATLVLQRIASGTGPQVARTGAPAARGSRAREGRTADGRADVESEPVVRDATVRNLYAMLDVVAPSPLSVLILGETGVGKELYAAAVHTRSSRSRAAFLRINCAALPESILEAELFGYEKGAFTGAASAKPGLFEAAHGGTVFLDEVAELPASTQAKLLRVLEGGEVMRLGALAPRRVDIRVIAATNRDPRALVGEGRFRADLYFRLNGITVTLPPLRNRTADVAPLARHFAERTSRALGRETVELTPRAIRELERYAWPGNVRELKNVVDRAVVLCTGRELDVDQLSIAEGAASGASRAREPNAPTSPRSLRKELREIERARITDALANAAGNQSRAAKMLGMSRYTLIDRIEEYGLARPRKKRT
jgi:transcriptional regulator with GAF, ATPase, and Fis domain